MWDSDGSHTGEATDEATAAGERERRSPYNVARLYSTCMTAVTLPSNLASSRGDADAKAAESTDSVSRWSTSVHPYQEISAVD
ncbi:hypothetical protein ACLOJK_030609 [Asimina triloba]